jgi:hypothetical protein
VDAHKGSEIRVIRAIKDHRAARNRNIVPYKNILRRNYFITGKKEKKKKASCPCIFTPYTYNKMHHINGNPEL